MDKERVDLKPVLRNIAQRIKERRAVLGLSQERLAERAELSSNFLSRIEIADKTPSLKTLVVLARALEVPISYLLGQESNAGPTDAAHSLSQALNDLSESDVEYALEQFRHTVDYLKWKRR